MERERDQYREKGRKESVVKYREKGRKRNELEREKYKRERAEKKIISSCIYLTYSV